MKYQIIDTVSDLERVCSLACEADTVMLDTEFVRTRTYYPQLGLIQLFDGEHLSLIDPTAIDDMSAFEALLKNGSVLKVLHACGEDLEVFRHSFGCVPVPMVDTQIMAAFLGHGLSTGFAALVKEYQGTELDKSESRADWLARPLSEKQLDYAAADVFYLAPVFEVLKQKIVEAGWWEAAVEESELITEKRGVKVDPEDAYLDIKGAWQLKPQQLAVLKPLAAWRIKEALRRDLALNFVFKEQDLWAVARFEMTSQKQMENEGFDIRAIRRHGDRIISIVKRAGKISQDEWPAQIDRLMDYPGYKSQFKILKDEVAKASNTSGLATEFLASKKQLNQFLSWVWKKERNPEKMPDVMLGWRRELLGEKLNGIMK